MAKIVSKGCSLKQDLAGVFTVVAQVISINGLDAKPETYDARTLDGGVGLPKPVTGYVESGELTAELFLDPSLAGHKAITALISTPAVESWKLVFSDNTEWPFSGSVGLGIAIAGNDGVKATATITPDGMVTYPA